MSLWTALKRKESQHSQVKRFKEKAALVRGKTVLGKSANTEMYQESKGHQGVDEY